MSGGGAGGGGGGAGGGGRRRGARRKKGGEATQDGPELWRRVPDLEPVEPITPVDETAATALLRSLGPPPLPGQGTEVLMDLSKVVVRASQLASALAAAADLLEDGNGDDSDESADGGPDHRDDR